MNDHGVTAAEASDTRDDRAIVSSRRFAVSREELFDAWIDPARLARWWGPRGFTNTFEAFDPRPGGEWRFVMHGPDGNDYTNRSVFVEIVPLERIVFDHLSGHHFRAVATFTEEADGTRLEFRMIHETAEAASAIRSLVVAGNEQNFDKLEVELGLAR
jgi:uncharacterized protein YndB with AHSA1/START domain